jgi:formylglycine-generating enzyme required for sulfatase activity
MNQRHLYRALGIAAFSVAATLPAGALTLRCPRDSVKVGDACIDSYEASVWQIPLSNTQLVKRVQAGRASLADLTNGGATQVSPAFTCSPAFPTTFDATGNWTSPLFAVSVAGVLPTSCVTWFQAEQACALSGKRLLTNQEWQRAAAGTPDPGTDDGGTDCNVGGLGRPLDTGSRAKCVSNWGTFDMVGNLEEWVADWVPQSTDCPGWGAFSDDVMCLAGASTAATGPSALVRGGGFTNFTAAGVFALDARPASTLGNSPALARKSLGFRCGRTTISTPAITPAHL